MNKAFWGKKYKFHSLNNQVNNSSINNIKNEEKIIYILIFFLLKGLPEWLV